MFTDKQVKDVARFYSEELHQYNKVNETTLNCAILQFLTSGSESTDFNDFITDYLERNDIKKINTFYQKKYSKKGYKNRLD